MTPLLIGLLAAAFIIGIAIGSVGVGGVLLGPTLIFVAGIEVHRAMATSLWSFAFTGIAGALMYAQRGSIPWRLARDLVAGALPGALVGVQVNVGLPEGALVALLGLVCVGSGILSFRPPAAVVGCSMHMGTLASVGVGAVVGFASTLTGTGGPVLALPLLLLLGVPVLPAIGASQLLQLPVAASGTLAHLPSGRVDIGLGLMLGLIETVGLTLGVRVAHALSPRRLGRLVALALIGAGTFILIRVAVSSFAT